MSTTTSPISESIGVEVRGRTSVDFTSPAVAEECRETAERSTA